MLRGGGEERPPHSQRETPGRQRRSDRRRQRQRARAAAERDMDPADGLHHVLRGLRRRSGERVALPLPLLQKWWR